MKLPLSGRPFQQVEHFRGVHFPSPQTAQKKKKSQPQESYQQAAETSCPLSPQASDSSISKEEGFWSSLDLDMFMQCQAEPSQSKRPHKPEGVSFILGLEQAGPAVFAVHQGGEANAKNGCACAWVALATQKRRTREGERFAEVLAREAAAGGAGCPPEGQPQQAGMFTVPRKHEDKLLTGQMQRELDPAALYHCSWALINKKTVYFIVFFFFF